MVAQNEGKFRSCAVVFFEAVIANRKNLAKIMVYKRPAECKLEVKDAFARKIIAGWGGWLF